MSGFVTLEKIIELKERNKIFSFCKNNLIIASRVYNVIESKRTKCTKTISSKTLLIMDGQTVKVIYRSDV